MSVLARLTRWANVFVASGTADERARRRATRDLARTECGLERLEAEALAVNVNEDEDIAERVAAGKLVRELRRMRTEAEDIHRALGAL